MKYLHGKGMTANLDQARQLSACYILLSIFPVSARAFSIPV